MQWIPGQSLEYIEQLAIEEAYRFYRGNKTQTANALRISIRTLNVKLEKYEAEQQQRKRADDQHRNEQRLFLERARGQSPFQVPSSIPSTATRPFLESTAQVANESKVSVSERKEVQEVLPRPNPSGCP